MSEASDQAADIKQLADAVLSARAALAAAEKAATDYTAALAAGTSKIDRAKEVEIEAARAVAKAQADKAQAMLRAEADGTAAAQRAAKAHSEEAKAAVEASKAIEAAERKKAQAIAESAAKSAKLKELAIGALGGEETVEKYNKTRQALSLAGDASLTTGQRMLAGASAAKFAGGAVGALATQVLDFARASAQAAAESERQSQRLASLGGAYDRIRETTAGAADAQVAFNMQFALADAGVAQVDSRLALLARTTREYATQRQVTQEQASSVVQRALAGDAQAAAQLGVNLNGVTDAAQRQTIVLRALEEQQRGHAVATRNATEQAQTQEQAWDSLGNGLKQIGALALHPLVSMTRDLTRAQEQWNSSQAETARYTDAAGQAAQRQAQQLERTATIVREQRALARAAAADSQRDASIQLQQGQQELDRLGVHIEALGRAVSAEDQLRMATMAAHDIERRAGEEGPAFDQRRIKAQQDLINAIRRKNDEANRDDARRNAEAELGMLVHQMRAHGSIIDSRIRSISPMQRVRDLTREIAGFTRRENEDADAARARFEGLARSLNSAEQAVNQEARQAQELLAARREERDLLTESENLHSKRASVERVAGETALDYLRRRNEAQREFNQLAQQGADEARTAFNEFAQRTREQLALERQKEEEVRAAEVERTNRRNAERADKERERQTQQADTNEARFAAERANALDQRLRESFGLAQDQATTATQAMAAGAKTAYDAFGELASGIAGAVKQAAESGGDAGAAVAKYVDEWTAAKAVQWGLQAAESLAGAGVAYFIRPDAVPGLLASAAQYAGLAAVAGITTAAIPNAPTTGASGVAGGGDRLAASSRSGSSANAKAPQYVINVSGFVTREDVEDGLVRAMRSAQQRHGDFLR